MALGNRGRAVLLTGMVSLGALSTDMYLPALPDIMRIFGTGMPMVQLTLSAFLIIFGLTQLVYGPLSDRYGRRPLIIGGLGLYAIGSALCAVAQSIEFLIFARALQAAGACAGPVLARAMVRDLFDKNDAARYLAYMASAMALVPALAPVLGGWVAYVSDWRSIFWLTGGFAVLFVFLSVTGLPESNAYRGHTSLRPAHIVKTYLSLWQNRIFVRSAFANAFTFAGMFAFISGSGFVLIDGLGVAPENFGWCFGAVVFGYLSGAQISGRLSHSLGPARLVPIGLTAGAVAATAMILVLTAGRVSVIGIVLPASAFFAAAGLILPNAMAISINPFPEKAGAASAMMGAVQTSGGAVAGVVVGQLYDGSPWGMVSVIAVCAVAGLAGWVLNARHEPSGQRP